MRSNFVLVENLPDSVSDTQVLVPVFNLPAEQYSLEERNFVMGFKWSLVSHSVCHKCMDKNSQWVSLYHACYVINMIYLIYVYMYIYYILSVYIYIYNDIYCYLVVKLCLILL